MTDTNFTDSEYAQSEMPVMGEATSGVAGGFPPYPPYATVPAPPSVADTIVAGRDLRLQHKSTPRRTVRPPPKPAKPKGPKATDVKLSRRAARAHARCLRLHSAVLTDRLERMSKPQRRHIIYLWREHAHSLPAETIARLRAMLDADEPFKPDQAYEYFINLRKSKKRRASKRVNQIKKDVLSLCADKKFIWARNATVAFARGIQQRLSRPGCYAMADGMLRLSNIILDDICGYMRMKTPSRRSANPKARFMMEMSDKVAVWIDEILGESDDRMLMMDFDEDEDVIGADEAGDVGFTDDFLNMMAGDTLLKGPQPAYLKFTGEMLEAFKILSDLMYKKGNDPLLSHGKYKQTYAEGADELKSAHDFEATEFNTILASQIKKDLSDTVKSDTPNNIAVFMKDIIDICSNYLAQNAEFNKDKGPAFRMLVKNMKAKPNEQLYLKSKAKRTFGKAASELDHARGLESNHDDPNLSQEIHSNLSKLVENVTPVDLKTEMSETVDASSKYLSQCAVDENERGPAFDILINELEKKGAESFSDLPPVETKIAAAYALKSAPGLTNVEPNAETVPTFKAALHKAVDTVTPKTLSHDMNEVIERCANYLSAFVRDRDKALQTLLKMMKSNASKELVSRNNYTMNYGTGASEIESAPILIPFMPVKDISDEIKDKLNTDVENSTPPELIMAMKALVPDVSKYLSQPVALRSGAAGERYPLNFLAAVKQSLGERPLYKYKSYGQTYSDAAEVLKYAGPLEYDPKYENLQQEISTEMNRGIPSRLAPTITAGLKDVMVDAAKHLAKIGVEKGEALDYLLKLMKEEGETPLGYIQGYQQSYNDGVRRIENAPSLTNEKVDKGVYESVRGKLTGLVDKKPATEYAKQIPGIVEESSKFLASPFPESEQDKRRVLADLMARNGDTLLGQSGLYKITYTEGGDEIMKSPVTTTTEDDAAKKEMIDKVNAVIPEKKLQDLLNDPVNEGATHLANIIKGRGEAMQVLHDEMMKKGKEDFLSVGAFKKGHSDAAEMLESADHFGRQHVSPILEEKVAERMKQLSTAQVSDKAKPFLRETSDITTHYLAGVATDECELDAKALGANDDKAAALRLLPHPEPMTGYGHGMETSGGPGSELNLTPEEAERRKKENENEKKRLERRNRTGGLDSLGNLETDPEREQALQLLHSQLRARGEETFYKQPHAEVSHAQCSDWLSMKPPMKVDKSVKESGDTARLHKKFERKLSALMSKSTPAEMYDTMQDVVIESSRILSEYFVAKSYKALVREALISEMQKRGNEILVEIDGAAETFFFAAQRLKKVKSFEVKEPCTRVSYYLVKKMDEMIRCRSMARKLTAAMKEHIKDGADYLSEMVTKADEFIEAYVSLLGEMEIAGDNLLIEGNIPKTYKDAAAHLRQLTSFEDQIKRPNAALQSTVEGKLRQLMANVSTRGYSKAVMDGVIQQCTGLLVSYIMLQGEKTEALKILVGQMDLKNGNVLLRHGSIRKSYMEGADMLRTKNTDQLCVTSADPVVTRKIQIKLLNLMRRCTPDKYQELIDDVIEDATMYLAVHLLQPQIIQVCKCMKNVFVQCELWCDEILRRVARPCCTCSRHVSAQVLADLAPGQRLRLSPGSSRAYAPGLDITIKQCPSNQYRERSRKPNDISDIPVAPCPAQRPNPDCGGSVTTSYLMYSTTQNPYNAKPTKLVEGNSPITMPTTSSELTSDLFHELTLSPEVQILALDTAQAQKGSTLQRDDLPQPERRQETNTSSPASFYTPLSANSGTSPEPNVSPFWQSPTTTSAKLHSQKNITEAPSTLRHETSRRMNFPKKGCFSTRAPIVTTDQMADWHAMMVSLMWNVQAWREWIQDNIDRALSYQTQPSTSSGETEECWISFQRRVSTEALQWRQYNIFSRQLTLRLALRYRDKQIVSPTRATVKTNVYTECQREMLDIIDMFNRWSKWLTLVIKETDSLKQLAESDIPISEQRWSHLKKKVEEYSDDWEKYNMHLKVCWEHKYRTLIKDCTAGSVNGETGPVWVVSACGAVPSGAVAAGVHDGELTWVARTTHRCKVLPAALHPSKHCCMVFADGAVHHYTKYQVLCNAEVAWQPWRAGEVGVRAVRVAAGVHIGRVLYRGSHLLGPVHAPAYRCHVVIFGRPFAFNCYELLVLAQH